MQQGAGKLMAKSNQKVRGRRKAREISPGGRRTFLPRSPVEHVHLDRSIQYSLPLQSAMVRDEVQRDSRTTLEGCPSRVRISSGKGEWENINGQCFSI